MTTDRPDISDDAILNGRLRLFQPRRGHRFGHDAILLAAATPAEPGDRIIELGAGVGAASLALLARIPGIKMTLVDIEPSLVDLASENLSRNGFANTARAVRLDVRAPESMFNDAGLPAGAFDLVLMNPPFNDASLQASPDTARRAAHVASGDTLRIWLQRAAYLLRPDGKLALIWRASREHQVLLDLQTAFGAVTIWPVYPAPGRLPIRILINARKGGDNSVRRVHGLTLTDQGGRPSAEAESILRGGLPIEGRLPRPPAADAPRSTTNAQKW